MSFDFLVYLNIVMVLAVLIGGIFAFRYGYSKEAGKIQEKVIDALKEQISTLEKQLSDEKVKIERANLLLRTIRYALKRRGLTIEANGDSITLIDEHDKSSRTTALRITGDADIVEDT